MTGLIQKVMVDITKIVPLCIRNKELLVVHKQDKNFFLSLGGKINVGESDIECLEREVKEEIGCGISNPRYFDTFEGITYDTNKSLQLRCYLVDLVGDIHLNPTDSVKGYLWVGRNYSAQGVMLASMLVSYVIPALIKKDLL